jgi:membrane protein implicated in regulation of membrane protease activity
MAWLILLIVLIAAALGVLGFVVKAAAAILLTLALVVVALMAVIWYAFKHQVGKIQRQLDRQHTQTDAPGPSGSKDRGIPPLRDDRY